MAGQKEFRLHLIQTMTKKVISEAVPRRGENCNESQRNNYHRMHLNGMPFQLHAAPGTPLSELLANKDC